MNLKKYFIRLSVLTVLCLLATIALLLFSPANYLVAMTLLVVYFTALTIVQHVVIVKALQKDPRDFIKFFFGVTVGILMLHLAVLFIYMYTHLQQAKLFTIAFLVGYVLFTTFEVVELLNYIHRQSKTEKKDDEHNLQG